VASAGGGREPAGFALDALCALTNLTWLRAWRSFAAVPRQRSSSEEEKP